MASQTYHIKLARACLKQAIRDCEQRSSSALTILFAIPRARGGGPNPTRALDRGAGRFLFDLIDGSERWGGAGAAALAAALELGGRLRQQADHNSTARGPRRIRPELCVEPPPISFCQIL